MPPWPSKLVTSETGAQLEDAEAATRGLASPRSRDGIASRATTNVQGFPLLADRLTPGLSRGSGLGVVALLLLSTAAFRCPGPKPTDPAAAGTGGGEAEGTGATIASTSDGSGGDVGPQTISSASTAGGGGAGGEEGEGGSGGCGDTDTDPQNCGACGRACLDGGGVVAVACAEGLCTSTCESGRVNINKPLGSEEDDGCERTGRRVFVTSESVLGDFGGADDAATLCNELAFDARLGGTWLPWLSEMTFFPSEDLTQSTVPFLLVGGILVANNWTELTDGEIEHPIDRDERNVAVGTVQVWSATDRDGDPFLGTANSCFEWSSADPEDSGFVGVTNEIDDRWSSSGATPCNTPNVRLYCFEQ
jgi:hypothetical protein